MTTEKAVPWEKMNRREFLALSALGAVPCILTSCVSDSPSSVTATPSLAHATPSPAQPTPSPTKPPPLTDADWATLARNLQGTLVRPDNPQYSIAYQLYDPRFDYIKPAAVAYCASPADVQMCLAFVSRFGLPLAPRGGGHSYAGYSTTTGLVVDVTRMSKVIVDAGAGIATVGAGARLIDVYAALAQYGMVLPAGSCPTVGIAGLTMGGGIGVLDRKFGLTCDNLLAAQVVTADGRVLNCDTTHEPDLFWALRGGGGGNFGVVTSFTFQAHPVSTLSIFTLNWPWSSAADMVDAWQNWAPQAPDELWSNCLLLGTGDKSSSPTARVNGVYVGPVASLNSLLQQLTSRMSVAPYSRFVSEESILDTMLIEAGCYGNQGIDTLLNGINRRQASPLLFGGGILLDASGGAINRVAANATAFAHRDALFSAQYLAPWNDSASNAIVSANFAWLADTWQAMRPYASGAAYQNYIDPNLANWQSAYYGANLSRLQSVKSMYDPGNLFRFAQSIPTTHGA
ncbi:MAG: FAD-binding oxidoreductase [Chloroflexi bacterium]|nr:MAG: FAD-binding oxidoreductase [Chloroflexota bacterium]